MSNDALFVVPESGHPVALGVFKRGKNGKQKALVRWQTQVDEALEAAGLEGVAVLAVEVETPVPGLPEQIAERLSAVEPGPLRAASTDSAGVGGAGARHLREALEWIEGFAIAGRDAEWDRVAGVARVALASVGEEEKA